MGDFRGGSLAARAQVEPVLVWQRRGLRAAVRRKLLRWAAAGLGVAVVCLAAASPAVALEPGGQPVYTSTQGTGGVSAYEDPAGAGFATFSVGGTQLGVTASPDGKTLYYNMGASVTVVDRATRAVTAVWPAAVSAVTASGSPIAISPDGSTVYTGDRDGRIAVFDVATGTSRTVLVAQGSSVIQGLAVSPDGATVYWSDWTRGAVGTLAVATDTVTTLSNVIGRASGITVSPDGSAFAVVGSSAAETAPYPVVTIFDAETLNVVETFTVGEFGGGVTAYQATYSPDGSRIYTFVHGTVRGLGIIDLTTGTATRVPAPGAVNFSQSTKVAVTADGSKVYLTDSARFYAYDVASGIMDAGETLPVNLVGGIVVIPDQPPVASFTATAGALGAPSLFDASASTVEFGEISSYFWDFGDGTTSTEQDPTTEHVYNTPGNYTVTLTLTSSLGTSTTKVFTGQVMLRNGGPGAETTRTVTVLPEVSLANPGAQNAQVGDDVSLPLQTTATPGLDLVFGATGLPQGLTIDPTTGVITGSPSTDGTSIPQVTVCFVDFPTVCDSVQFTWSVTALPAPTPTPTPTEPSTGAQPPGDLAKTGQDAAGVVVALAFAMTLVGLGIWGLVMGWTKRQRTRE